VRIGVAVRTLARSPGFAVVAILTLALGIGANTAIFSVLQGVVLAPLPYAQPDRLVLVLLYNPALKYPTDLSYPDFIDWRRNSTSFEKIAAFQPQGFDLTSPGTAEHVAGMQASREFFSTLGVKFALGREFTSQEDEYAGTPAVVISDRLWRDRFSASPSAVGKSITLNGVAYTIVGILPPAFRFDTDADVYTGLGQRDPALFNDRTIHDIACVARLKSGVSIGQAHAELNTVQDAIDRQYPNQERGLSTFIIPLKEAIVGDVSGTLFLLFGAVGVVLIIACGNVANLLMARSAARSREFAVRVALGAGRMHLLRQSLSESLLISVAGGMLGLLFAKCGLSVGIHLPRAANIGLNAPVLLFTLAISISVGILFSLAPAFKNSTAAHARRRSQSALVIGQIALTLVLLVGAGLLFRTVRHLWEINPGFDARNLLTFRVGLSPSLTATPARTRAAYQQLISRVGQIPGVEAVDMTALVPLSEHSNSGPFWEGTRQPASMAEIPRATYFWTGPDYIRTMSIPLLRGRYLSYSDTVGSKPVVVIDNVLAQRVFPGRDPVGQTLTIPHWGAAQIVGVIGHVKHNSLDGSGLYPEQPEIFGTFYQLSDQWIRAFAEELSLIVRTRLEMTAILPAIKAAVSLGGGDQPVYAVESMQEIVSAKMSSRRLPMTLLAVFAGLALLLASVGLYGVISYSVILRTREIGIRMAIGARKADVFGLVLGQGLRLAGFGLAIGIVVSLVVVRALPSFSHLLYGVAAGDPLTFAALSSVMIAVSVLACYIPARRAANVDPMVALREQ